MFAVLKKELKSYFYTPIGYIFISLFLVAMSFVFYNYTFSQGNLHFEYVIWDSTVVLTFLIPVITMRMFSEEKKNGTDQLLVTSPKSIITIVFGKFFAATFVTIITCLLMFAYYGILSKFGHVNIVEPLVAMLGFILLSMAFISFGMFASAITEHQVIAAIIPIVFFLLLSFASIQTGLLQFFSLTQMYQKFPQGIISLKEVVGYISFIFLFVFLTIIFLQRRKSVK
ncbi:MAG: ABC transporter permease [Clostridia bacterium]|jgi:ABC-2 type transport system permease protein|nr:ABC transporter permease [Clostridia bacterium]MCI9080267.1 ABC transporter permease [Lachnospiraceae bacterium]